MKNAAHFPRVSGLEAFMNRIAIPLVRFTAALAVVLMFAAHAAADERLHPSREDDEFQLLTRGVMAIVGILGFGAMMLVRTLRKRPAQEIGRAHV